MAFDEAGFEYIQDQNAEFNGGYFPIAIAGASAARRHRPAAHLRDLGIEVLRMYQASVKA
jgi:hypothetical protein